MTLRTIFVQLAGLMVILPTFCISSLPQDNDAHLGYAGAESAFISMPNPGIVSPTARGMSGWDDTTYNEGVRFYKNGQYGEAATAYKKACDRFAKACTNLGFMYNRGQGVEMSSLLAAEYYLRGCEHGNALGCTNLGVLYWNRNLPKNDKEAVEFFERGCRNGDSHACRNLGYLYKYGDGVPKDEKRAAEQYKMADQLSHVHRIPIHVEDGLILVSLTIQDEDAILILDTGSSRTALIRKYLPPGQGLRPTQKVMTLLGTGEAYAVNLDWKLDGREIQLPALIGDFNFPHGAVGILGADVLGKFTSVRFNYSAMVLTLED